MGDLQLSVPELGSSLGQRPSLSLGDFQLELSPESRSFLFGAPGSTAPPDFRRAWFNPDWSLLDRSTTGTSVPGTNQCSWYAPGEGPESPRGGSPGDVLEALYKVPCVRNYLDERIETLERVGLSAWNSTSWLGRGGMIAGGVLVVGAGIALGPLSGVDIPVPGLSGFKINVGLGSDVVPSTHPDLPSEGAWGFMIKYGGEF